jgi:membrane protease subunit HflK
MQQVYGNATKVYVDQKGGNNILFLPLDKIIQMSASGALPLEGAPSAAEAPANAPTGTDPRSRDAFRSRDREARP